MNRDAALPLRVAFWTQGCRLNQYDTEVVKAALGGYCALTEVPWHAAADLYVLNSCTVTGKAAQACRRLAREAKHRQPQARVVVVGCHAQTQPQDLAALPEIAAVVGNTCKVDVASWLPAVLAGDTGVIKVAPFGAPAPLIEPAITSFSGHTRAHVKIQDGCDLRCSYCAIWRARGPARSRSLADVLAQVGRLHGDGRYREIILTGVNLGAWGRDLPAPRREPAADLAGLLVALCDEFPDIRLRLSSLLPGDLTPVLATVLRERPQLQPHVHLSVQSGSDAVLARMRRPYRCDVLRRAAAELELIDPACGFGADVIVGFPGETDAEFAATIDLIETLPFSYVHIFRYSPRPDTPAAAMTPVRPEAVRARAQILRELADRKRFEFGRRLCDRRRPGVLERPQPGAKGRRATLDNYAAVTVSSELPAGTLVEVAVTGWRDRHLHGEVVRVIAEAGS